MSLHVHMHALPKIWTLHICLSPKQNLKQTLLCVWVLIVKSTEVQSTGVYVQGF